MVVMQVFKRKVGQQLTIGRYIRIEVMGIGKDGVPVLGVECPEDIPVHRAEVADKIFGLVPGLIRPPTAASQIDQEQMVT